MMKLQALDSSTIMAEDGVPGLCRRGDLEKILTLSPVPPLFCEAPMQTVQAGPWLA